MLTPVTKTTDGGFIISYESGSTSGPVDTLCSATYVRTIFQKYNSDASAIEWNKCYLNNVDDSGFIYLFPTTDGGSILGGIARGSTFKFLIHKENPVGVVVWSKSFGDGADAILRSMTATDDGNYVMIGETNYADTDFIVHYGGWTDADIAVMKLDSNGNKLWARVIGGLRQ